LAVWIYVGRLRRLAVYAVIEAISGAALAVLLIAAALVVIAWAAGLFDRLR
jgi:hypothetical protein